MLYVQKHEIVKGSKLFIKLGSRNKTMSFRCTSCDAFEHANQHLNPLYEQFKALKLKPTYEQVPKFFNLEKIASMSRLCYGLWALVRMNLVSKFSKKK